MTKVSCEIPERYVNPLFEVFDGGDFILSSYRDIERPLTEMRIYFEDAGETEAAKKALADALEIVLGAAREGTRRTEDAAREGTRRTDGRAASMRPPEIRVSDVPDDDWKYAYRRHFKTEQVSARIFTVPEWEAEEFFKSEKLAPDQIALVSDPGMAFGTGKHETTKACLMYIDELVGGRGTSNGEGRETRDERRERETLDLRRETLDLRRETETLDARPAFAEATAGKRELSTANYQPPTFLDMGTGSGILSIAAAKLGCREVVGFDVDPEAVEAAKENAEKNGVKIRFEHFALGRAADAKSVPRPVDAKSVRVERGTEPSISDAVRTPRLRSDAVRTPRLRSDAVRTPRLRSDAVRTPRLRFTPADLVVANILGPLLIRFADEIVPYVKHHLVISGILTSLYPEVLAAYTARGFAEVSRKTIGEWTTGLLSRVSRLTSSPLKP